MSSECNTDQISSINLDRGEFGCCGLGKRLLTKKQGLVFGELNVSKIHVKIIMHNVVRKKITKDVATRSSSC